MLLIIWVFFFNAAAEENDLNVLSLTSACSCFTNVGFLEVGH